MNSDHCVQLGRRAFLKNGTLVMAAATVTGSPAGLFAAEQRPQFQVGLITDLHHADKPPAGSRHYRETLNKLAEAATEFEKRKVDFVVELGDLIDAADSVETELHYLTTINRKFSAISQDRHYVLGNHCVDTLTKEEFLGGVGQAQSYYSFDRGDWHCIILDSCFSSNGQPYGRKKSHWTDANLTAAELQWLQSDLNRNDKPVVVFAHQRLDVSNNHGVKNCPEVRHILESSGKVRAVLQGHSHQNDLNEINGIHYCTLVAMVEGSGLGNNGYSLMGISPEGNIYLNGFRKQQSRRWERNG